MAIVDIHNIAEAGLVRGCRQCRRTGCVHQNLAVAAPDLERDLAFIRVSVDLWHRLGQRRVERFIERGIFLVGQGHTHDALQ
ncbi:hypothetical protein D3C71_2024840 [compost metagenome]